MRPLLLTLVVLAGLFAADLRFVEMASGPDVAISAPPDLAPPYTATEAARRSPATLGRTEYCGPARLAVVRRVTHLGETEALTDILPPSRWEAWPEVVRACTAAYGALTSPPGSPGRPH